MKNILQKIKDTKKSSTAVQLAHDLGWQITMGTDEIREIMRLYNKDPFLQGVSHDRWKLLGKKQILILLKVFLNIAEVSKKE